MDTESENSINLQYTHLNQNIGCIYGTSSIGLVDWRIGTFVCKNYVDKCTKIKSKNEYSLTFSENASIK